MQAGEHSEIALIEYRTAVSGSCWRKPLLLLGSTVLHMGCIGKEKRQGADNKRN
jgi:hypothetical protein